jgi:microcystin-dependent protein
MSNGIKITAMAVVTALSDADVFPVVQGGINMQSSMTVAADYLLGTDLFATVAQGAKADTAMQPADGITLLATVMMIGEIRAFAFRTPPAKWLEFGQAVSRTTYADLYAAIGITFGPGNGTTTFDLPPKGYFLRSWDHVAAFGAIVGDSFKAHNHAIGHAGGYTSSDVGNNIAGSSAAVTNTKNTDSTGGAETAPKHIMVLECIYAGV